MKKMNLIMLLTMFVGGVAHADYQCTDYSNEVSMTVYGPLNTRLHNHGAVVKLESATEKTTFFGTMEFEGGHFLQKIVVKLQAQNQGDQLTIVSKPKFCGRGSCDFDDKPIITANLKIGETQTYFSCNETNP